MRTIVQLVLVNDTGDSFYRMRWPARDLAERDPTLRVINLSAMAKERFQFALSADLLVLFQSQDYDLLPIIAERKRLGRKTLVEYNDNFYAPQPWSPVAEPWSSPLTWQAYEKFIAESDGLIVTGQGLVELFSARSPVPIHILRNEIPHPIPEQPKSLIPGTVRIGWAGSLGHMADILSLAPLLRKLEERYPQVVVHLMGNETLPNQMRLPRVKYTPWGTMDDYFRFWGEVDIGIAPLLDTPYNRCRSDIKALEMISSGVLPLCQKLLPYEELAKECALPLWSSLGELEQLLVQLIEAPKQIPAKLDPLYRHVRGHRLQKNRPERHQLYSSLFPEGEIQTKGLYPEHPGYFEMDGTPESEPPSTSLLVQVQKLWNDAQGEEAERVVEEAFAKNAAHPELALARIKILARRGDPKRDHTGIVTAIEFARRSFPRDLRFPLFLSRFLSTTGARVELWRTILETPDSELRFFQREITQEFIRAFRIDQALLGPLKKLVTHFPNSVELRFTLATALEQSGDDGAALTHYEYLLSRLEVRREEGEFGLDRGYLHAWVEALRGRNKR